MGKIWKHFKTITRHKLLVAKGCFQIGLYKQGILHDLSKYSPSEFFVGVKYYQGTRSPNNAEREEIGYSSAWLHHKGRNKHHMEYWIDYSADMNKGMTGMEMPIKYVVEMFCDRVAACKVYKGEEYNDESALEYYKRGHHKYMIHKNSDELLCKLLTMLAEKGERYTFAYIRKKVLKNI